jgi:predicted nucleic acid-binding protein
LRIFFDTNILARANERSTGPARRSLQTVVAHHTLLIGNEMLTELSRVLRYPRLQELYRRPDEEIYNYVATLDPKEVLGPPRAIGEQFRQLSNRTEKQRRNKLWQENTAAMNTAMKPT